MKFITSTTALVSLLAASSVSALPTGPGSCDSPTPFTGGPHTNEIGTSSFAGVGLQVKIGDTVLDPNTPFNVPIGMDHKIEISSTGTMFKGFLLKLFKNGTDTTGFFTTTNALAQVLNNCANMDAAGLGHNSNVPKTAADGTLNIPSAMSDLKLEVASVISASFAAGSVHYLSDYTINAIDEGATMAPTMAPTSAAAPSRSALAASAVAGIACAVGSMFL